MRQIGTVAGEEQLQRLTDYLLTLGIRTHVDRDDGRFSIWALDEDRVPQAREELARFVENSGDERYVAAQREAARLRDDLIQKEKQRRKNVVDVRAQWTRPRTRPVTFFLIAVSCAVFFATDFGRQHWQDKVSQWLVISDFRVLVRSKQGPGIARIWEEDPITHPSGFKPWRLVTPIFLHGNPLHLLFNMMAMHSLGTIIEIRRGPRRLALMVLAIAIISNVGQYYYSGPAFGGMSGVAFGLFGYLWMKSKFDPEFGIMLNPTSVAMMLGWLALGMTGFIPDMANAAHFVGLIVGTVMGYGPIALRRWRSR